MEKSKAKKGLPVFIGVAAVWMGTHFGPGVASGTQLNQYYVRFGLPGIFVTIIAMGFLGYALYCSMEFSRIYKAYDYQSWVVKLFGNKYVVILFDISFLVTILTAASGSMNAVAVLLEDNFGINYWLGVAIIIVCAMLLCAYGAKLVRAASSYMMFIVVGILLVIMVLLAVNGDGDLSGSIANQAQNLSDAGSGSWLGALWSAIIYGSFQATIVANIASVAEDIPNRRESKKAAVTGFLANTILLIVLCMMLFSYTNVYDITSEDLPFYSLLQRLGYDWLTVVYIIIVLPAQGGQEELPARCHLRRRDAHRLRPGLQARHHGPCLQGLHDPRIPEPAHHCPARDHHRRTQDQQKVPQKEEYRRPRRGYVKIKTKSQKSPAKPGIFA